MNVIEVKACPIRVHVSLTLAGLNKKYRNEIEMNKK